ncbi:MAG TPA: twin-arginine translocase TatA/TatE family subunit [Candidatus Eremiobacteraceae bacterium]|nr:twin-arginine translocase TatA/TatE family subunit [Candidatus Eremiobacteraceae bacterium]
MLLWLGPTDMAVIFVIALLLFGPDQLPKVARQLGDVMRQMQNTTQSFMLEMDRAAREADFRPSAEPDDLAVTGPAEGTADEVQPKDEKPDADAAPKPPADEVT